MGAFILAGGNEENRHAAQYREKSSANVGSNGLEQGFPVVFRNDSGMSW